MEPADELQIIEGLKHMSTAIVPGIYDSSFPDRKVPVEAEQAYVTTPRRRVMKGCLSVLALALLYSQRDRSPVRLKRVWLSLFSRMGERGYLSTALWE